MAISTDSLIEELTFEEKMSMLAGADMWHSVAVERLDIPALKVTDGPNGARGIGGVHGKASASFPVGAAMGATWNTALIARVGKALAEETRAKGAHILLGPTVNIHRSPVGGRNFESFTEDPYLMQRLAVSYINGLQDEGVGACVKHYLCNDQEFERHSLSSDVTERAMREIYLLPFEGAVKDARTWSVMSSYNRVNGTWVSEHDYLLLDLLKGEWQFDGLVISDWYGTYTSEVISSGLDLEMPGPARWMAKEHVLQAVEDGKIDVEQVDDKVRRLLLALQRTGAFDEPLQEEQAIDNPEHRKLIREVGQEAIVLLKNEDEILPLDVPSGGTLAVIGANAKHTQFQGGGSSEVTPHYVISPLEAIEERAAGKYVVEYALGAPLHKGPPSLAGEHLKSRDGREGVLLAEFFDNLDFSGKPSYVNYINSTWVGWFGLIAEDFDPTHFSLRISGSFSVPERGRYKFSYGLIGKSGKLQIDGELIADLSQTNETLGSVPDYLTHNFEMELEAGREYSLQMEYVTIPDIQWRAMSLGVECLDGPDPVAEAVELAKRADKVVIVAGLNKDWEAEGNDRVDMRLPNRQDELIEKIAAANSNVVVVLNLGSPVEMPWLDKVSAVLHMWYLGQETGNALADILYGDVSPSGKLATTFPKRLEDNPSYINFPGENGHVNYGEGIFIGYRYYDHKDLEPLFPFGFGLSYTKFGYKSLSMPASGTVDEPVKVSCELENLGGMAGKEVVQLYVRDLESSLVRPPKELKAFKKVMLQPGETKTVEFELDRRSFAFYDDAKAEWVAEPGDFEILIGSSSRHIYLKGMLKLGE
jgi:beta-glucosidase